jgi:hypothetical protein
MGYRKPTKSHMVTRKGKNGQTTTFRRKGSPSRVTKLPKKRK